MSDRPKILPLIVVPVIVALLVAGGVIGLVLTSGGEAAEPPGFEMAQASPSGEPGVSSPGYEGEGMPAQPPADAPVYDDGVQPLARPTMPCDFPQWLGNPADEAAVKETGRPFRLLPPGAMMTMDYSAERINLDLDSSGIVTKVWCG